MNPSTWGAAPPDFHDAPKPQTQQWQSSPAMQLLQNVDPAAMGGQPMMSRKRPEPEPMSGGGLVPAAFRKKPNVQTSGGSNAPAAFQKKNGPATGMMPQQGNATSSGTGNGAGGNPWQGMMPGTMGAPAAGQSGMPGMMGAGGAAAQGGMAAMMGMMGMMSQMNQMNQMAQMAQMAQNPQMAQMAQMAQMSQMNQQMSQMSQMGQMGGQMSGAAQALLGGGGAMQALPDHGMQPPSVDMSSWEGIGEDAQQHGAEDEQQRAIREAVEATQQAQYMQQVQFLEQVRVHASKSDREKAGFDAGGAGSGGTKRFVDDYLAFKLCVHYTKGHCMQGLRCVYAHCFEELHPASPDMPAEQELDNSGLSEQSQKKEESAAPNLRLRKKRDLCRKFMDTGKCNRGQTCPNAHGEHEIGKLAFVLFDKVKLTICQAWTKGKCSYGDKCFHAHGDHEIGQKRREFLEGPPMRKRAEGQTLEEWRREILRNPDGPTFM